MDGGGGRLVSPEVSLHDWQVATFSLCPPAAVPLHVVAYVSLVLPIRTSHTGSGLIMMLPFNSVASIIEKL